MALPNLLPLADAARLLYCRPRTLAGRIRRGELEGYLVAGRYLLSEAARSSWLQTQAVKALITRRDSKYGRAASALAEGDIKRRLKGWTSTSRRTTREDAPGSTIGRRIGV